MAQWCTLSNSSDWAAPLRCNSVARTGTSTARSKRRPVSVWIAASVSCCHCSSLVACSAVTCRLISTWGSITSANSPSLSRTMRLRRISWRWTTLFRAVRRAWTLSAPSSCTALTTLYSPPPMLSCSRNHKRCCSNDSGRRLGLDTPVQVEAGVSKGSPSWLAKADSVGFSKRLRSGGTRVNR
ncbi:hypothetical protein BSG18_57390 [Pseudomonas ogarae]|nr:hypothetical protein BSF43_58130 [Pseudomonas ogarae]PBJ16709.1 hypothetical protein BSG18_57390 [Pseudomonas ogarae]